MSRWTLKPASSIANASRSLRAAPTAPNRKWRRPRSSWHAKEARRRPPTRASTFAARTSATTSSTMGFPQLASRVGFHPSFAWRARSFRALQRRRLFPQRHSALNTAVHRCRALFPVLPAVSGLLGLALIVLFLLIPATQDAVDLINNAITAFFDPEPLPKLDFSAGYSAGLRHSGCRSHAADE